MIREYTIHNIANMYMKTAFPIHDTDNMYTKMPNRIYVNSYIDTN